MQEALPRPNRFREFDKAASDWMGRNGIRILRYSLGIIFIWFGTIKFIPGLSPIDDLATRTFALLTFHTLSIATCRIILAAWEVAIGLGLISGIWLRVTLALMVMQLLGAMTPLVLFPGDTWKIVPVVLTIDGQYIVKDVVLLAAAIVIGATVRGKKVEPS